MMHSARKFIQHLQSLDQHARRTWLVGLTAGTMVLVVGTWITYMRSFVVPSETDITSAPTRPGFAAVFAAGIQVLSEEGANIAAKIRSQLTKDHEIIIDKTDVPAPKNSIILPVSLPPVE